MDKIAKPKIQAIYPLSTMQTALLFHHLTQQKDLGFLNVQCTIDGVLKIDLFKQAWNLAIKRHAILRTSVHWEKIKKPIQIVKPSGTIEIDLTTLDWTTETIENQRQKLKTLKANNKKSGLDFQKKPLIKVSVIKTMQDSHVMVWSCHHLLLDGWSSSIILKDVFTFYEALVKNVKALLEPIPPYKSYLNWLKDTDENAAKTFWLDTFKDFETPFFFNKNQLPLQAAVKSNVQLSTETVQKAQALAKSNQITLNTLFQGLWAIIISKYSNSLDVVYGNTVSGRSGDFPNIELMAGMFTNVIPVRTKLDHNLSVKDCLKKIQSQQLEARKFEHVSINSISEWLNTSNQLFDSLFVFENFPWKNIKSGGVEVHSLQSGNTSTYPLTLTVISTNQSIDIHLSSDKSLFSDETNHWFLSQFEEIINVLDQNENPSIKTIFDNTTPINPDVIAQPSIVKKNTNIAAVPKNKIEVDLLAIWQNLLNKDAISSEDNFFEIGGKSLLAVRMFTLIEDLLNIQLSPTTLLEHPTIASLATLIENESGLKTENWNNLVPIRSKGSKAPIFCLHAGGGHVFFYNTFAKYIDKDRPVYAIQPSGLFGKLPKHKNIEAMAVDYVKEIRMAYPEGPFNLMVYCHSTAVGFEMSNLLKNLGHKANLIVMDTMAEQEFITADRLKMRVLGFLKRLLKNPTSVISIMVSYRYKKYIKPFFIKIFGSTEAKNTSSTTVHLINIYNKYKWKSYDLDITLVLTKKVNELFNKEICASWNKLANHVHIINTEGDHRTLFDEPDVKSVAETLNKHLN
ncbi:condensation domain-containing protein [Hwangdonia seohaensis]|uniref:Condensation domain-containing protein n=1 Tax=Hwangdonia seohaensis TaxID=1240727 RepID=A0ABW3RAY7_9FLAO|nr:condensation domain-containing protein [Hwangdonia seohaensis]